MFAGLSFVPPFIQEHEMTRNEQRLCDALNYLLEKTVDADLTHGIELTEGEMDARARAIRLIDEIAGEEK